MNVTEYQAAALRTLAPGFYPPTMQYEIDLLHTAMGLVTEVAELFESVIKEGEEDLVNRKEELGDITWYLAVGFKALGEEFQFAEPSQELGADLITCVGAFMDMQKRAFFYNEPYDREAAFNLLKKIAGAVAYIAVEGGFLFEDVFDANIANLTKRFPDKFTEYAAVNRDLDAERTALEGDAA